MLYHLEHTLTCNDRRSTSNTNKPRGQLRNTWEYHSPTNLDMFVMISLRVHNLWCLLIPIIVVRQFPIVCCC